MNLWCFFFSQNTLQGLYNVITSLKMLSRGLLIFFSIFKNSFSKFGFLLCQLWWYLYAKVAPQKTKGVKTRDAILIPSPLVGVPLGKGGTLNGNGFLKSVGDVSG